MNIFELFGSVAVKGLGKVEGDLTKLEKRTQQVQKGMRVMGLAFTAVGAAGLAMIQSTKKINAQLSVTAVSLGITTKEMRDLTLATTNVTFPIDQVMASFDLLARAGITDQKVLSDTATAFDTLGDALGLSASQVTEVMVPAMKTFGLSAEEIVSKTDTMAFMVRNSTISLEDFNTMVGYTSQDMVKAGLTIDDMAAAMMFMSDNGVEPGKVMLREWNKAVTQSQKEGIALTEALGMTNEELEVYKTKLKGATGFTQELADLQNEQFTIMDKLKQKWSELTLKASGFLEPLEPILAGMTALGPLMMAMSTSAGTAAVKWALRTTAMLAHKAALIASTVAIKAVAVAQWLWNAAMTANPIGLIILAVLALIAIGIALWKNWDKVTEFFGGMWEKLKAGFAGIRDFFVNVWEGIVNIFKKHWDLILAILFPAVGIPILIARNWGAIVGFFKGIWESIVGFFEEAWVTIKAGFFSGVNFAIEQLNKLINLINKIPGVNIGEIGRVGEAPKLEGFAKGVTLTEPTLLTNLRTGMPFGVAAEAGPERLGPGGGTIINNYFDIAELHVREEADVPRIARELLVMQEKRDRGKGR